MPVMLERWNDDKMDALAAKIEDLGSRMEKGFARVDTELREQRQETRELRLEMNTRFEAMQRLMTQAAVGISASFITGFAALIALVATRL
jgi:hypothetical protein